MLDPEKLSDIAYFPILFIKKEETDKIFFH